jgi:SPP1 gp7 family putative phage head morphogenesis protein
MSINDDILSRGLKERALLSLYEKKLDTDLTKIMSSHKKRLVTSALKNGNKSVNALNRALTLETRKTYRKIYRNGISELKALANTSSKFHNSTLKQSLGKVYRSKVYTGLKVNDLIINSAGTYSEQIASISLSQQRKIKDVVRKGMIDNLAVNKIAKNVGNAIDLPAAQLKTLSRTAITETSSNISNATYKLNEDVIDGYQYVATLDSRTSLICGRLDGKVFRLDDNRGVRPPQHFNCRSTTVPIVKSYEDLNNTDSSRISKRRLKRLSGSKRASFNGQVPSETNFEKFLSQQDDNFKLTVLGNKRRVEIFNTGKLKFTQFSTKEGQLVSVGRLEELLNGVKTKPVVNPIVKIKTELANKPKIDIPLFGDTDPKELKMLELAFGDKEDTYTRLIQVIPAPGKVRFAGSAWYVRKEGRKIPGTFDVEYYDVMNFGSKGRGSLINRQTTAAHEYAHRIDYRILEDVAANDGNFKKLIEGYSTTKYSKQSAIQLKLRHPSNPNIKNNVFVPKTYSEIAGDEIAKDYTALRLNSPTRRASSTNAARNAERNFLKTAVNPTDNVAREKYYADLVKKQPKLPGISDSDLMYYLKETRKENYKYLPVTSEDLYKFKAKINDKMMLPTGGGNGYDLDFNTKFNDYVGAITRNEIGDGHEMSYYLDRRIVGLLDDGTGLSDSMIKESYAEYVSTMKHPDKIVRNVEIQLMKHYAPNTTKAYDTLMKRLDKIYAR